VDHEGVGGGGHELHHRMVAQGVMQIGDEGVEVVDALVVGPPPSR
jgi:hypothetical protein